MALTLKLSDGTSSRDLIGSTYAAQSLDLGNPSDVRAEIEGLMRDGWDLIAHRFTRRVVSISLRIDAASQVAMDTAIKDIQSALRAARLWAMYDLGNRWRLQFNPGGSAASIYFIVKGGSLSIPAESLRVTQMLKDSNPIVLRAALTLECDPLAEGTEETLSNYFNNAGFELGATASADVTVTNGTPAADTADKVEGAQSCAITLSAAAAQFLAYETVTMVGGNHVWVINYKITGDQSYEAYLSDAGGTSVAALTADGTWRSATVTRDSGANTAITAGVRSTGAVTDVNDVVKLDKAYLGDGTTAPTGWVSCRAITNHDDLTSQAHTNYLDVYPQAGDYPAKVQVKLTEAQAHTKVWLGARHGARRLNAGIWHEGEDFATWDSEPADGTASGGAYGSVATGVVAAVVQSGTAASVDSITVNINPSGSNRLLIVGITTRDSGGGLAPTGITFGGAALTKLGEVTNGATNSSIWYKIAPAAGAANVVATFAGAMNAIHMGCIVYTGAHQTTPLGVIATATGSSTTPSVSVTTGVVDRVFDAVASQSNSAATPGASQTERWDLNAGTGTDRGFGSDKEAASSGTSTTMSWSCGNAAWAQAAVAIKPAYVAATPQVFIKSVTTPPVGAYRVLARVLGYGGAFGVAMGYAYGGVTLDPSASTQYAAIATTTTVWHLLDIGSIIIPPAALPSGATIGTLTLRLCVYRTSSSTGVNFACDWVMLLPVDYGSAYAAKASGTDVVVIDTISRAPTLALWNTSDVFQSRPQQEGTPPDVDPDGSRLYLACDDGVDATISDGFAVAVRIVPQYMVVP